MTTLSRLLLDPRSGRVQHDLGDVQAMHKRILSAFPDKEQEGFEARASFGVLYRVERRVNDAVPVLVQSTESPDWSKLPEGYLQGSGSEGVAHKSIDGLLESVKVGHARRFRLRANATRRLRGDEGVRGKRVELVTEEDALQWLHRQALASGFKISEGNEFDDFGGDEAVYRVRATSESKVYGFRGSKRVTLGSFLFEGLLEVTDADSFRQAITGGIGRGKAYGFGLLSLATA